MKLGIVGYLVNKTNTAPQKNKIPTYKTCPRCIITEFECIVDVQNHEFGWVRFFKSLNKDDEK